MPEVFRVVRKSLFTQILSAQKIPLRILRGEKFLLNATETRLKTQISVLWSNIPNQTLTKKVIYVIIIKLTFEMLVSLNPKTQSM